MRSNGREQREQQEPRVRAYHRGGVRQALVAEATRLAAERGTDAISLREAGRRVGVSHAAAYRHVADRRALIAAAATEGMLRLAAAQEAATQLPVVDDRERVCHLGVAYVQFALAEQGAFRLMFAAEVAQKSEFPELRAAADRAAQPLLDAVAMCQPAADVEQRRQLAVMVWSLVHGAAVLALNGQLAEGELRLGAGAEPTHALVRRAVELLLG